MHKYFNPTKTFGPNPARPSFGAGLRLGRPSLKPEHAVKGAIVWLPPKVSGSDVLLKCKFVHCPEMGHEIEERGYDHPALILNVQKPITTGITTCTIVKMTSFHGLSIQEWQAQKGGISRMMQSIPIEHLEQPGLRQLRLKGATRLGRQGWVQCGHIFDVPVTMLHYYTSSKSVASVPGLTPESFQEVMNSLSKLGRRLSEKAAAQLVAQQRPSQRVAVTPSPQSCRKKSICSNQVQAAGRGTRGKWGDMRSLSAGNINGAENTLYNRAPTNQDPIPYKPVLPE